MAANAASMRPRVDVPDGLVTSGTDREVRNRESPSTGQRRVGWQHDDQLLLREQPADEPGLGDGELGEPDLGAAAAHQRCDGGGVLRLLDAHDDAGVGVRGTRRRGSRAGRRPASGSATRSRRPR